MSNPEFPPIRCPLCLRGKVTKDATGFFYCSYCSQEFAETPNGLVPVKDGPVWHKAHLSRCEWAALLALPLIMSFALFIYWSYR